MSAPWLEAKPAAPSQWDDEFEADDLDTRWTRDGSFSAVTLLDPFSTDATAVNFESVNKHRRSWLMVQPQPGIGGVINGGNGYEQDVSTLPTDCFIWIRASNEVRRASAADGVGEIHLVLYNAASGLGQDRMMCGWDNFASIVQGFCQRIVAGVSTNLGLIRNYLGEGFPIEYAGIQKLGNTYHGWMAPESGNWVWMGSGTFAVPLDRLRLAISNANTTAPGRMIVGCDFVRVLTGKGPP